MVSVVNVPYNVRLLINNIEKFSRFKVTHVDINLPIILEKYYYLTVHVGLGNRDFVLPTYLAQKLNSKCDNSDIIHTHIKNYVMRYAVRRRKSNKNKIVATVHNPIPEFITYLVSYDFHRDFNIKQVREKIELLKHYDMVVTVSKFIADMLRELYGIENAIHIPNPIDPVKDVQEKVLEFDLQKYGLELKGYVVWLPNRLLTYKNPLLFLRLAREFPDETFVMASNQITWEGLVSYLKRHGIGENPPENLKVITLPSKNSRGYFLHILQNAKFSIITSYYEGFGYSVLESLSLNVPVIGPNIGGPNEIITGEVGLKYDAFDRFDLFDKFEKMLFKWKHIKNTVEYVQRNYHPKIIVPKYDEVYKEVLR